MGEATGLTAAEFTALLQRELPGSHHWGLVIEAMAPGTCRVRLPADPKHHRPGGSVSGPAMMAVTDTAIFGAVLSRIGPEVMAVTADLSIRFLRRPPLELDLRGEATLLKLGRRLAVAEVRLWSGDDAARPVAHATGTYALP
jgi:uncharacterized protein (TIGR00369 family)